MSEGALPSLHKEGVMAYTVRHQKADGSVEVTRNVNGVPYVIRNDRESVLDKFPCNPMSGRTAAEARRNIAEDLKRTRKELKGRKGYIDPEKRMKLKAKIPAEVQAHVFRNEGAEAAQDIGYLMRAAQKMGIDCRVS